MIYEARTDARYHEYHISWPVSLDEPSGSNTLVDSTFPVHQRFNRSNQCNVSPVEKGRTNRDITARKRLKYRTAYVEFL